MTNLTLCVRYVLLLLCCIGSCESQRNQNIILLVKLSLAHNHLSNSTYDIKDKIVHCA